MIAGFPNKTDLASKWIIKQVIASFTNVHNKRPQLFKDAPNGNAAGSDRNSRTLS